MMPDWIETNSFLFRMLWQTTAWLIIGLLAASALNKRPARAHSVLLMCIIAAIITPTLSFLFEHFGWGLLSPRAMIGGFESPPPHQPGRGTNTFDPWLVLTTTLTCVWALLASVLFLRLCLSIKAGLGLLSESRPVEHDGVNHAVRQSTERLALANAPEAFISNAVRSPVIWCWSRTPRILLPPAMLEHNNRDLPAVLCHELAHCKRRDHIASLIIEIAFCLLAWHPLMWSARRLSEDLCEQACDAWVLFTGVSPTTYADSLLSLIPQPSAPPALAAVRHRRSLPRRIARILSDSPTTPNGGALFTLLALLLSVGITASTALAHRRPPTPVPAPAPGIQNTTLQVEPPDFDKSSTGGDARSAIEIRPSELDLGFAPAGTVASGSVWLINRSRRPITITGSKASCGCTTVQDIADTVLEPGRFAQVEINIEADGTPGQRKTKHVTFLFEGLAPIKIPVHVTVQETAP